MIEFFCWVAGDRSRCTIISAYNTDDAEAKAAKYFGVSPIRVMSRIKH